MPLLSVFANNLLSILLLRRAGFVVGKTLKLDPGPLGRVIFYILSPLLIFNILTTSGLSLGRIVIMMGFTFTSMLAVAGLAFLAGLLFRPERITLIVVVPTTLFTHGSNYGLPFVSFAFGQKAPAYASIFFVTSNLMYYTLGILIASLGSLSLKRALLGLLKIPAIYAIIPAVTFILTGWSLPSPLQRTVTLAAGAAVPGMLILLGLELTRVEWSRNLRVLSIPVFYDY